MSYRELENNTLKKDLEATVKALANAYEELSLLYSITSELIGLDPDEIARKILTLLEKIGGYKRTAVLFFDIDKNLYPKTWSEEVSIDDILREREIIQKTIESKKTRAICKHTDTKGEQISMLVSPITGKDTDIGAVVVLESPPREFLANEIKLINTLSGEAGLFIENSFLFYEIEELLTGSINCLIKALEASSPWTAGHTERVVHYAMAIGREMNLPKKELERLKIAALLHDIGKIGVPDYILNKPGKLEGEEVLTIKGHTMKAEEILLPLKPFKKIIEEIKYHHERWDGKGFYGLSREAIPLIARIIAVADAFDAMTTDRPYRERMSFEEALAEIEKSAGAQFDPKVVKTFITYLNRQHQGTLS